MSNLREWVLDRQENGDDGTGYEQEGEVICTFCNDNSKSCRACDDSYEGE